MVYQWSGYSYKVPAQVVGDELEQIEARNGAITKEIIVDAARPKDSVLHRIFEWDDAIAGENWRKQQAKMMLSALHIIVETKDENEQPQNISVRAYANATDEGTKRTAVYVFTPHAMGQSDTRDTIIANAKRELAEFANKYRIYSEFGAVIAAIDAIEEATA